MVGLVGRHRSYSSAEVVGCWYLRAYYMTGDVAELIAVLQLILIPERKGCRSTSRREQSMAA